MEYARDLKGDFAIRVSFNKAGREKDKKVVICITRPAENFRNKYVLHSPRVCVPVGKPFTVWRSVVRRLTFQVQNGLRAVIV